MVIITSTVLFFTMKEEVVKIEPRSLQSVYVNHGEDITLITDDNLKENIINWINQGEITKQSEHNGVYSSELSIVLTTNQDDTFLIETNVARHDSLPLLQLTYIYGDKHHYYTLKSKELNNFLLAFYD